MQFIVVVPIGWGKLRVRIEGNKLTKNIKDGMVSCKKLDWISAYVCDFFSLGATKSVLSFLHQQRA